MPPLSPLALVARGLALVGARWGLAAAPACYSALVAVPAAAAGARAFHVSAPALGGRYTAQTPDRVKHWRQHLSKKAKRRHAKRVAQTKRRDGFSTSSSKTDVRIEATCEL